VTIDIRQRLWVRRAIATSTATIRAPVDPPATLGTAVSNRDPAIRHFSKNSGATR
jgi:hypothetical protein